MPWQLFVWLMLTRLSPNVAAGILAAGATVGVALHQRRQERQIELDRQLGPDKRRVYEEFMASVILPMLRNGVGDDPDDSYIDRLRVLTTQMLLWGGDDVVAAWVAFRAAAMQAARDGEPTDTNYGSLVAMECVLRAIRQDLGYPCRALAHGDLLRMFINDLPDALPFDEAEHLLQPASGEPSAEAAAV